MGAAAEENFSDWLGGKAVAVYGLAVPKADVENMERVAAVYQKIQSQFAAGTVSAFILDEDMYDYFVSGYGSYIEKEYSCEIGSDAKEKLGKTLSADIESVFLPLSLNIPGSKLYLRKGAEAFRPGVDQLPGACMEYLSCLSSFRRIQLYLFHSWSCGCEFGYAEESSEICR